MLGTLATFAAGAGIARARSTNPYYAGPVSDHFDGVRFFNPGGTPPNGFSDLMRWRFGGTRTPWPTQVPVPTKATPDARVDDLRVTMVGHATMLVQVAGLNILTDPVWSPRVSPVTFAGPKRVADPGVDFDALPRIDVVLLSHSHYDHLDIATLKRLEPMDPLVITPLGNDTILRNAGVRLRVSTGDWGDRIDLGSVSVHLEPCHHWSARGMNDRSMALWASFVVTTPVGTLLHIGDTGFDEGRPYRDLPARHGTIRAAILPVGAYEPRWFMRGQHQNPDEAVQGFKLSGARYAVGHHWGVFQLTDEGREAPLADLAGALAQHGVDPDRFRPLAPGEAWDVPVV